jgi:hypothetical protein
VVVVNGTLINQLSIPWRQQRDAPFLSETRLYCVRIRPNRSENEFVLKFTCRAGNQMTEKARLTLYCVNR